MPDFNNFETIDTVSKKSDILYIGCDLNKFDQYKHKAQNKKPLILWNHRWEFDKNPEDFFDILFKLKSNKIDFEVAILGEQFKDYPKIFDKAKKILDKNIVQFGYCESFDEYANWLCKADVLPVTSNQDFFGISIMEAICAGNYPILPERLTYPELFDIENNHDIFYKNDKEFERKLIQVIENINNFNIAILQKELLDKFDWNRMSFEYDKLFKSII